MQTLPNPVIGLAGDERPLTVLVRRRFWIYLALFLAAVALIATERSASGPSDPANTRVRATRTAPAATAPANPPDDRPLLLPDR
jgi:hypothetical protein